MSDEARRQNMVMMGPGFGANIGGAFVLLIWLAIGGWVAAIGIGLLWLFF